MKSVHFVQSGFGISEKPLVGIREIKSHDRESEEKRDEPLMFLSSGRVETANMSPLFTTELIHINSLKIC